MNKIIFSRKGFDSSAGGYPSPIFKDGTLFSIPIPDDCGSHECYGDLSFKYEDHKISQIIQDITNCGVVLENKVHNDPLILDDFMALGQVNQSQSHLDNQNVSKGDLFLFYGWFRRVERGSKNITKITIKNKKISQYEEKVEKWQYTSEKSMHLIWAYMYVDDIYDLASKGGREQAISNYPELVNHRHMYYNLNLKPHKLYVSKSFERLKFDEARILTDLEAKKGRSFWKLPNFLNDPKNFTYLNNFKDKDKEFCNVQIPGRGQEFVYTIGCENNVKNYIKEVIKI